VLLAFDTATPLVTVALHDGERVLVEHSSSAPMKHGEHLAPIIERAMSDAGIVRQDLTAVAVGTLAAWTYSVVATFAPQLLPAGTVNVYFEAAAVIVTLILLGRYLEARAKGRTSEAIKRLVGLQPKTARVRRDDKVVELALADVVTGDLVDVRHGERIAVDGALIHI